MHRCYICVLFVCCGCLFKFFGGWGGNGGKVVDKAEGCPKATKSGPGGPIMV